MASSPNEANRKSTSRLARKKSSKQREKAAQEKVAVVKRRKPKKVTRARDRTAGSGAGVPAEVSEIEPNSESEARVPAGKDSDKGTRKVSRKQLLEQALQRVQEKLESEGEPSHGTIGALVQLLKLDRDMVEEDEVPQEIRVLWQEINGGSSSGE